MIKVELEMKTIRKEVNVMGRLAYVGALPDPQSIYEEYLKDSWIKTLELTAEFGWTGPRELSNDEKMAILITAGVQPDISLEAGKIVLKTEIMMSIHWINKSFQVVTRSQV